MSAKSKAVRSRDRSSARWSGPRQPRALDDVRRGARGASGRRPHTSGSSGSPTHTESSRARIPTAWSSSLKGQCSSRPCSWSTTTAFGPLTSAATRWSGGRGRPRPSARRVDAPSRAVSGPGIVVRRSARRRGRPARILTGRSPQGPRQPLIRSRSGTPCCRASPASPLTRRTRNWHRRFNACAVVYGHLHIRGSTGSTAHRSRRPRSDIPGNGTAEGEWAPICARSCWPPGRPRSDTGSAPRSGGVPTGRVRVCSSCTSTSGPIRPPNNGFSPFSTLTSGHAGAGSGSRSPSVSSRRAARHSASTSANGGGARTRTRRSVSLSTASRSLGWAGSPRTRTST